MTSSIQKILESKRALRRELAARPVAEKLGMLEAMRERESAICEHKPVSRPALAMSAANPNDDAAS